MRQSVKANKRTGLRRGISPRIQASRHRAGNLSPAGRKSRAAPKQRSNIPQTDLTWSEMIPDDDWSIYRDAIKAVRSTGTPFMLGGGFGLATYVGHWRNTKDIDLYILPESQKVLAKALAKAGFADYYEQLPYDRGWIYRSYREGVIVDLIWSMANRRAQVHEDWFQHATSIVLQDELLQVLPPEELLWCKLYVFQRDHCDWPDLLNLLYATGPTLNWSRLLQRVGKDWPVLKSLLTLFSWVCPNRAALIPASVREDFELSESPAVSAEEEQRRVKLLDSRGWFAPFHPKHLPLQV